MKAALILGTQLFADHPALQDDTVDLIIMIEAQDACSRLPYHRHKLILLLSAMRHYHTYLKSSHRRVEYHDIDSTKNFGAALRRTIEDNNVTELVWMIGANESTNQRISALCSEISIAHSNYDNALFMTPEHEIRQWFGTHKQPLMETFYRWQRQRTGILCQGTIPEGGKWNYDSDNREALPKQGIVIPTIPFPAMDDMTKSVASVVDRLFPDNPGESYTFWLPVTHEESAAWLARFIAERFDQFGPYEDAMKDDESFLFHGVLSPLLNCGLLTVDQVVQAALEAYAHNQARLSSVEGFIRQIIGWREYMYGIYLSQDGLKEVNYFGFTKELEGWWYNSDALSQDLPPPVLSALKSVYRYGYNHHIERLMVLGNWFLLNEYSPQSVYRWFSSMYVDAYEWVMVPNVMGMSQYADGGKTATKPYISGGNYLQKMGRFWDTTDAAQKSQFTKMYWEFLDRNYDRLKNNFRMALVLKQVESRRRSTSKQ